MFEFETYTILDWVKLGASIFILGYMISLYNNLVRLKMDVFESYSNIEVSLKQRNEELPKLVQTVKQYVQHEKNLFERLAKARMEVSSASHKPENAALLSSAESAIRGSLGQLFALAEDTPEIRSNQNFIQLQNRISQLDSEISDRREYYNSCVNNSNTAINEFPDILMAIIFRFKAYDLLTFQESELKDHSLEKLFET